MVLSAASSPSVGPRASPLLVSRAALALVLVTFSLLVVPSIGEGAGSWDSYKIRLSIDALLDFGRVIPSRSPGHPTTEFYLFGGIGASLRTLGGPRFDSAVYLTVAWVAALLTALVFHGWLRRAGFSPGRSVLATICLVFSPQFLAKTLEGEEFITGLLCLVGALAVLSGDGRTPPGVRRLLGSALLFALAAGCRTEFVLVEAVAYPLCLFCWRIKDRKTWAGAAIAAVVAQVLIWLPILLTVGFHLEHDAQMSRSQMVLAWGYKLLFVAFGFPVSVVLVAILVLGAWRIGRRWLSLRGSEDFGDASAVLNAILMIGVFALLPTKASYVLVSLPFLLWLAARGHFAVLVALSIMTPIGAFVGVDIFRNRMLTTPHFTPGVYRSTVAEKPARQLAYLEALGRIEVGRKSIVIGNIWAWVCEHHVERQTLPLSRHRLGEIVRGYVIGGRTDRVLVSREILWTPGSLARLHELDYEIVVDELLWRTLFARYDVTTVVGRRVVIENIPVRLVAIAP